MPFRSRNLSDVSEEDLIRYVLAQCSRLYNFFGFVLDPALGLPRPGWDFLVLCSVEREHLGLPPGKPGDVDIVIVPVKEGRLHMAHTMAIEVKRLYLPLSKRSRDTNSSGIAQARGLIRDGFPFVGILHLIIAEPSLKRDWHRLALARVLDQDGRVEIVEENAPVDPIIWLAPARQLQRLQKQLGPSPIGLNSVLLTLSKSGTRISGLSTEECKPAQRNSKVNHELLKKLAYLCCSVRAQTPSELGQELSREAVR